MDKTTNLILAALGLAVRHYSHVASNLEITVGDPNAYSLRDKAWELEEIADKISNGKIKIEEVKK